MGAIFHLVDISAVKKIPLLNVDVNDKLVWGACSDGRFTVKSAYRMIKEWESREVAGSSSVPQSSQVWRKLWNLSTPPRVACFTWKFLNDIVPTRKKLWNHGISCPIWCSCCPEVEESLEH